MKLKWREFSTRPNSIALNFFTQKSSESVKQKLLTNCITEGLAKDMTVQPHAGFVRSAAYGFHAVKAVDLRCKNNAD